MKKIAIYGGTFDPIHHGHLIVAREALERLGADEVIFIPARVSPLRKTAPIARDEIRLLMIQAAIENEPGFAVDDCELRRPPPSYTIDTVEQIRRRKGDATIYCLIGEDNVDKLTKWRRFADLEKMVRFVVLDRTWSTTEPCLPGYSPKNRHFCDGNQKESCHWSVDSIFRTAGSGRDHSPRKTLPGATEITPENLARTCAELASNKKAEDIVVLDLRAISTFTDFFVICSATSEPQLKAIANEIETRLREDHSIRPVAIDGFPASQWIVLDYLQVVVHVFHRDKRSFYSLEDLWGDAPRLEWEAAAAR